MTVFSIKEVSQYLHCSISTIRKMVRNKQIPYFRIGNRLYFKQSYIDIWIDNQCKNNFKMEVAEEERNIY